MRDTDEMELPELSRESASTPAPAGATWLDLAGLPLPTLFNCVTLKLPRSQEDRRVQNVPIYLAGF